MNLIFPLLTLSLLLTNVDGMRIFQCSFREMLWMVPEQRRGAGLIVFIISLIAPFITSALPKCKCPTSQKAILKVYLFRRRLFSLFTFLSRGLEMKAHGFVT